MYKFLALTALLAVASADPISLLRDTHPLSPTGRIVGGVDTTIEEVPYQVQIRVLGSGVCGGSIISTDWILTAAHCNDYPRTWYTIRAGSTFSNSGGSIHSLTSIINHANYYTTSTGIPVHDIGLYRLASSLTLDSSRQVIPLYNSGEATAVGAMGVLTGWGRLTEGGSSPIILQTVSVPVITTTSCNSAYAIFGGVPAGQICAAYAEGGMDSCQGDSGGPFAVDGRLAGIVSWGNGCARPGFPGVYTEVASYREWISTNSAIPESERTSIDTDSDSLSDHIVGGQPTTIEAIPYQAQIQLQGSTICGGSIIAEKWVLTAAHCVIRTVNMYRVRVGSGIKNQGGTVHVVNSIIEHYNYHRDEFNIPNNDICLFLLSSRIQMDSTRQPIPLFSQHEKPVHGDQSLVSGWGALREGGNGPRDLHSVVVPIVSKDKCIRAFPFLAQLPFGQICAGYIQGGKDACHGDSGGPLAINGRLAGITSWGSGCARPRKPGVYTEVAPYRYWIYYIAGV